MHIQESLIVLIPVVVVTILAMRPDPKKKETKR